MNPPNHKWKSLGPAFYRKHLWHKPDSEEISKAIREFKAKGGEIELIESKEPEPNTFVPVNRYSGGRTSWGIGLIPEQEI